MPDVNTKKMSSEDGSKDLEALSSASQEKEANNSTAENDRDHTDDLRESSPTKSNHQRDSLL